MEFSLLFLGMCCIDFLPSVVSLGCDFQRSSCLDAFFLPLLCWSVYSHCLHEIHKSVSDYVIKITSTSRDWLCQEWWGLIQFAVWFHSPWQYSSCVGRKSPWVRMGGTWLVPCSENLQLEWIKNQDLEETRTWLQWEMDQFSVKTCSGLLLRLLVFMSSWTAWVLKA